MYKDLKELLVKYEDMGLLADEYFAREAIDIISNEFHVADVVDDVIFELPEVVISNALASYISTDKVVALKMSYRKDLDKYFDLLYKKEYEDKSKILGQNIFFLNTLFHELDHAAFHKEVDNGRDEIIHKLWGAVDPQTFEDKIKSTKDILPTLCYIIKLLFSYARYHDYAPYETRAIVSSTANTSALIQELYDSYLPEKDIAFYDKATEIMYDYELVRRYKNKKNHIYNSPSYDFCNRLKYNKELFPEELNLYNEDRTASFLEDSSKYKLADRILQGLQISEEEYNQIFNESSLSKHKREFKKLKKLVK